MFSPRSAGSKRKHTEGKDESSSSALREEKKPRINTSPSAPGSSKYDPLTLLSPNTPRKRETTHSDVDFISPPPKPVLQSIIHDLTQYETQSSIESFDSTLPILIGSGSTEPPAVEHHPISITEDPLLSPQQTAILQRILDGENVFFTGPAGTGKSVLLRAIVKAFDDRLSQTTGAVIGEEAVNVHGKKGGDKEEVEQRWKLAVTASTGMAAINVGGKTLHSWAGIGLGDGSKEVLADKCLSHHATRRNWRSTHTLVIDEVSMIDGKLFDKLEYIARIVRENDKPFGGMQIILSGDFFQLPPVSKEIDPPARFAFEGTSWSSVISPHNVNTLDIVFRQADKAFVNILGHMRVGTISRAEETTLRGLKRVVTYPDGIEPVELFPTTREVERLNNKRLKAIPEAATIYTSVDIAGTDNYGKPVEGPVTPFLSRNTTWPARMDLKVGAAVMLVTNLQTSTLVNGSLGKVISFQTVAQASANGTLVAGGGAHLGTQSDALFPVVAFAPAKYSTSLQAKRTLICTMEVSVNNSRGTPYATRRAIPLILAWSLTIHKAQGQSLSRVKVDLKNAFAEGQSYVAISRAISMDGLEIQNFNMAKLRASPRVLTWMKTVEVVKKEERMLKDE